MRKLILAGILCSSIACGSNSPSPTAPSTPAQTQTKIISLGGNLDFGNIQVGQSFNANMNIRNSGNAPLTISGIQGNNNISNVLLLSWTSGTIAAGASQDVTVRFSPTAPQNYSGTITVNGDQTSGTNTIAFNGNGSLNGLPIFSRSGVGDTVFSVPNYVSKIHVVGTYNQYSSNFIVKIDGRLFVNELLGTGWSSTRYDGTLLSGLTSSSAGQLAITNSSGVAWSFTEVR